MPQPLPPTIPESLNTSSILLAYPKILHLEKASDDSHFNHQVRKKRLIHARILGYLIREGPSTKAKERVAQQVNSCLDDDQMDKLGKMYYEHYIHVFRRHKGGTPAPSSNPSRASSVYEKDMVKAILHEPPLDHSDAKKKALIRDNHRCLVTGRFDCQSVCKNLDLEKEVTKTRTFVVNTQCAHIFPASINDNISSSNTCGAKHEGAAAIWAILKCFGYEDFAEKLSGGGIHSLDNVMTLDPGIRDWFDRLEMWFEAVDGMENTYAIRAIREFYLFSCKTNPITFQTETGLALPNPDYLEIHAACCRIAYLTGATEHMNEILEDLEDMQVLSNDGSSAHVLSFALQPFSQEVVC